MLGRERRKEAPSHWLEPKIFAWLAGSLKSGQVETVFQFSSVQFSYSVVSNSLWLHGLQHARLPCPSITNSQSLLKLIAIELVMPSNHLILCCPHPLLPSVFPSTRIFSSESVLHIRWPMYWSFSFSISPFNKSSGLISFRIEWLDLLVVQGTLKSLFQHHSSKHQFFGTQPSLWSYSHICGLPLWLSW